MSEGKCTGWRKSSYSNSSGNCVEVRDTEHLVGVRDTKQGNHGPILEFPAFAWRKFLAETKSSKVAS